jgi:hypothetical protein
MIPAPKEFVLITMSGEEFLPGKALTKAFWQKKPGVLPHRLYNFG